MKPSAYASIPVEAAKEQNPVKSSPESIARAKKWWNLDGGMCHGASGDGKGDIAKNMKLNMADFNQCFYAERLHRRRDLLRDQDRHNDMPGEGPRIKTEQGWDVVNDARSLPKAGEAKAQ